MYLSVIYPSKQTAMSRLIIIFLAFVGSTVSVITGHASDYFQRQIAFYFYLIPMLLLLITSQLFNQIVKKNAIKTQYTTNN